MKNELGGSATQQELIGWRVGGLGFEGGVGARWNEQGNCGVKPHPPVNSNPGDREGHPWPV